MVDSPDKYGAVSRAAVQARPDGSFCPAINPTMNFPEERHASEAPRSSAKPKPPSQQGRRVFLGCDLEISRRYGTPNAGIAIYVRAKAGTLISQTPDACDLGSVQALSPGEALHAISQVTRDIVLGDGIPLLIACDHTASCSALLGLVSASDELPVYVYFDAHLDLGRNCPTGDLVHNGGFVGLILQENWAEQVVNIGGRSLMARLPIPLPRGFTSLALSNEDFDSAFAFLRGKPLYVSIDADVLDLARMPDVCCPEPGGMSPESLIACCNWLARNCRVLGADLSELLPDTGNHDGATHLVKCLLALSERAS